ncbi:hypothetical protein [Nocardia sp. NPDC051833]|uniref:hypothetical protein n=1 Tax=Nocardia sp. NPDC051833 TaxID=3155674 RepID=UPI00342808E6
MSKPTSVPTDSQRLIDMLWWFHMAAGDPSMRDIADAIEALDEDQWKGTANHETVRRTMGAITLPQWETVEVIFLALCELANVDPDDVESDEDENPGFNGWEPPRSHREELHRHYRLARYGTVVPLPRTRDVKARLEAEAEAERRAREAGRAAADPDPWGTAPVPAPSDEPLF